MSFFSSAVKLISGRKKNCNEGISSSFVDHSLKFDFLQNYAKESFSVLIVKPLSGCALKFIRTSYVVITGLFAGVIVASLCFGIFLQFGSLENTILSSLILNKFEKFFPESDLSIKSAMLRWNSDAGTVEIAMNKIRLDDLSIPKISILPDYGKSFKQKRLIAKTISVISPKIHLDIVDDFKNLSFNPNLEKGGDNRAFFEPLKTLSNLKTLLDKDVTVKFINADVSISENGVDWKLKNTYCEHKIGEDFPRAIDCTISLPGQEYTSNISLTKESLGKKSIYSLIIDSINPFAINCAFAKRNTPMDRRIFDAIDGYNLPISGIMKLNFDGTKFIGGRFDLVGSSGSIKLPARNTLSLNLGKKIDNGNISGSFSGNNAKIDSINISYGNSVLHLTDINIPLYEFKFLDVANIDGTLSLTNIDTSEMETILPENLFRSAISAFRTYLPGFKLKSFKTNLKGEIAFGNRTNGEKLDIDQGVFKIENAKIPLGGHLVTNVNATGSITDDGFDIKLTSASFRNTIINNGRFFISNKGDSWIGKINANVAIDDILHYAQDVSPKLASLQIDKLHLNGNANLDMKLVHVDGQLSKNHLPFQIVEGNGVIKSDNNTKELRLSWNDKKLSVSGDLNTGKNKIHLKIDEDLANNSGNASFKFVSKSDFLTSLIPHIEKCSGDYDLKIDSSWKNKIEEHDIDLNLKDATMFVPMIGDVKLRKDKGSFTAHILKDNDKIEFQKMALETPDSKFIGKMTLNGNGDLIRCSLDELKVNGCFAKINILKNGGKILFSAIGNSLNISRAFSAIDQIDKSMVVSSYIDLERVVVSNTHEIRNVKGNLDIKNGKIIGGACYAVFGDDITLAFTAKDIEKTNDSLLSLSISDAGKFLKYLKITDTVNGGSINIVTKSSKNGDQSLSGAFEISNFIVKNNNQLMKLVSLSSTNWLPSSENLSVGFNFCIGNFLISNNQIMIENGKAISPTIGISYNGSYDRENDDFSIYGISLPMSTILSNQRMNGALAANYQVHGSLGRPVVSVDPLKLVDNEVLKETFGNMIPITFSSEDINNSIIPVGENLPDPFSQNAFDKRATATKPTEKMEPTTDKKFGVTINRGKPKR